MKRLILLGVGIVALAALAPAGSAEAKCSTKCLNKKIRVLTAGLRQQENFLISQAQQLQRTQQELSSLESCLVEAPLTAYGDPGGSFGYVFDNDGDGTAQMPFYTTALDFTASGDGVSGWALFDGCNTAAVASASSARSSIAPRAPSSWFGTPRRHSP